MFSKLKKQKSRSPVEEMEQFYLNQFLNNTKIPPQGNNNLPPFGQMMATNQNPTPQFQNQNGAMMSQGGFNPMMNNHFNPSQIPMTNTSNNYPFSTMNQNQIPNQFSMNGSMYPNFMPNHNTQNFNPNSTPMTNLPNQPSTMMNSPLTTNNMMNYSQNNMPYPMNNQLDSNSFQSTNTTTYPSQQNFNPSLMNESIESIIGAEPTFNDFSFNQSPAQSLPDLTPSLDDLTESNMLSNPYFRPSNKPTNELGFQNQPTPPKPNAPTQAPPNLPANQHFQPVNEPIDLPELQRKVDNMNIRLRKIESYLGFRPETTI